MRNAFRYFLLLSLMTAFWLSCYESEEGCLDSFSTNYAPGADQACDSCCVYPNFSLRITHVFDSLNFNLNTFYQDDFGNVFKIEELKYFVSSVHLNQSNGSAAFPRDSIEISTLKDNSLQVVKTNKNYGLVNSLSPNFNLGEFVSPGSFNQLSFDLGLDPAFNHIDTSSLAETHLLRVNKDSLYIDPLNGFIFQRIRMIKDTSTMESLLIEIYGDDQLLPVNVLADLQILKGINVSVSIKLDINKWLQGIDLKNQNSQSIISKMKENLSVAFSY